MEFLDYCRRQAVAWALKVVRERAPYIELRPVEGGWVQVCLPRNPGEEEVVLEDVLDEHGIVRVAQNIIEFTSWPTSAS
jgi:hypothetical protein